jgi:hypothetical protein
MLRCFLPLGCHDKELDQHYLNIRRNVVAPYHDYSAACTFFKTAIQKL